MTVRQESGCAKGHNDEFLGYRRLENESDDFRALNYAERLRIK